MPKISIEFPSILPMDKKDPKQIKDSIKKLEETQNKIQTYLEELKTGTIVNCNDYLCSFLQCFVTPRPAKCINKTELIKLQEIVDEMLQNFRKKLEIALKKNA